jgi:hypothetical protein
MNADITPEAATPTPAAPLNVDIGGWLKVGWQLFVADPVKHIIAALIVLVLSIITCFILAGPMTVGFVKCLLKKSRGQDYTYGELFDGIKLQFVPSLLVMLGMYVPMIILSAVPILGGLLALAWSVVAAPVCYFVLFGLAEATTTVAVGQLQSMAQNVWAVIKPALVMVIIWVFIANLISNLCCIFTMPIGWLAMTASYLAIFRNEQPVLPGPTKAA